MLSLALFIDLGSKHWAFLGVHLDRATVQRDPDWMPPYRPNQAILPLELLDFQCVINRGAVFGIGPNQRMFFIGFTFAALAAGIVVFARTTTATQRMAHIAIGLVLAGGIGNLFDRIVFGVVRDFLHMLPGRELPFDWRWPGGSPELFPWVFNLADLMLLTGMALLLFHMNRAERRVQRAIPAMEPAGDAQMTPES